MNADEQEIRRLVADWHKRTADGDVEGVLALMADDATFLVTAHPPMRGRQSFGTNLRRLLETHRIESSADIQEVTVSGDLAYCWSFLSVKVIPRDGGTPNVRAGSVLSIFRKQSDGTWVLSRDANLLAAATGC